MTRDQAIALCETECKLTPGAAVAQVDVLIKLGLLKVEAKVSKLVKLPCKCCANDHVADVDEVISAWNKTCGRTYYVVSDLK